MSKYNISEDHCNCIDMKAILLDFIAFVYVACYTEAT
jgi:hypothetical protein